VRHEGLDRGGGGVRGGGDGVGVGGEVLEVLAEGGDLGVEGGVVGVHVIGEVEELRGAQAGQRLAGGGLDGQERGEACEDGGSVRGAGRRRRGVEGGEEGEFLPDVRVVAVSRGEEPVGDLVGVEQHLGPAADGGFGEGIVRRHAARAPHRDHRALHPREGGDVGQGEQEAVTARRRGHRGGLLSRWRHRRACGVAAALAP